MCPPSYNHNGFVATHAIGHMMYGLRFRRFLLKPEETASLKS